MDFSKQNQHKINHFMMQLRQADKAKENEKKPSLLSADVVQTADFSFSPLNSTDRVGDSGTLLLAKRKTNRAEQYLVKHAYTDCACNEFVYTKLVQAMGYKMPDIVLFQISPGEKRTCFQTEYIMGAKYLNFIDQAPSYEKIREQALNWREYFSFIALYAMTEESDGWETPLAEDGYIYRVDTTDAFPLSNYQLETAGINVDLNGINPKLSCMEQLQTCNMDHSLDERNCDWWLQYCVKQYGQDAIIPFMEPFSRIQEIGAAYIDEFLNTLCYFYPDFIGDYFKRYITALQKQAALYLKRKKEQL